MRMHTANATHTRIPSLRREMSKVEHLMQTPGTRHIHRHTATGDLATRQFSGTASACTTGITGSQLYLKIGFTTKKKLAHYLLGEVANESGINFVFIIHT